MVGIHKENKPLAGFGCSNGVAKNRVDSEHIAAQLAEAGYEIRFDSDRTDAKVVVVNTCGFIGDAYFLYCPGWLQACTDW